MPTTPHEIILHNFATSPFSEKIRLIFGMKGLAWRSVEIPSMLPKPDLMPLTGGYRKTPVMQIGADIFCDTQIIIRELERRFPEPDLMPNGKGLPYAVGFWSDRSFFMASVPVIFAQVGDARAGGLQEGSRGHVRQLFGRSHEGGRAGHARPVARPCRLPRRPARRRPQLPSGRQSRP